MKPRAKPSEPKFEPLFDPILDELYRARDAFARKFNFDTDAICALAAKSPRTRHDATGARYGHFARRAVYRAIKRRQPELCHDIEGDARAGPDIARRARRVWRRLTQSHMRNVTAAMRNRVRQL